MHTYGLIFTFYKRRAPYRLLWLSRYNSMIIGYTAKAYIMKRLRVGGTDLEYFGRIIANGRFSADSIPD
ncbi:unnamed protein product [Fusarium fujikuroi]|nr:unnamed protein product [Fusarium fujikuroi]